MKAIIPVAGYGTRMRPHTDHVQKTLIPVGGKPALSHIVEPLFAAGIKKITFIIGHLGQQVVDFMQQYDGQFQFIEQKEMLGLAHAVLQGLVNEDEEVLLQLGDNIFDTNIDNFITSKANRIAVAKVDDPRRFGVVELDKNYIISFHEKPDNPPSNYAISGLYFLKSQIILKNAIETLIDQNITTKNEYQITDAFKIMLNQGEIFEPWECGWMDTGVPDTLLKTNKLLLNQYGNQKKSDFITPPVFVGNNVTIINSIIGPNVTIMDNSTINNCHISNCVILENTNLSDKELSHCVVGKNGSDIC